MTDTIFALSSGRPPAGIAVIRVSGPQAFDAASAIAGDLPAFRHAVLRNFRDPVSGELLDRGLLLAAPAPRTATGENIVEFQCHGGRATIEAMLSVLSDIDGLRLAEGGEFTRRALANGVIDLTEAEGLADLLSAETELQRKVALRRSEGSVRRAVEEIRENLLDLSAAVELAIDYVDEEDGATVTVPQARFDAVTGAITTLLAAPPIERLRDGVRVVVAGPPNTGKSSLVNTLAREERAIVTPIAGTTRDTIEVALSLSGLPIVLIDTAGLHETEEMIERIGIGRAERAIETADMVLWLGRSDLRPTGAIQVTPKADLADGGDGLRFSSVTDEGHSALLTAIEGRARQLLPVATSIALSLRERGALELIAASVREASGAAALEIAAHSLRRARVELDVITGRAGIEDMLDTLFSRFCVGK